MVIPFVIGPSKANSAEEVIIRTNCEEVMFNKNQQNNEN